MTHRPRRSWRQKLRRLLRKVLLQAAPLVLASFACWIAARVGDMIVHDVVVSIRIR
jgi:hypothetical protein